MGNIKVFYTQFHYTDLECSPFSLDGIGFEPESVYSNTPKSVSYYDCPAWKHKATRTFLIRSPIDFVLKVDSENEKILSPHLSQDDIMEFCKGTFVPGWCGEKKTIQCTIPQFFFWTKEKNVWIEIKPHGNTAYKNNFIAISSWFNLSQWSRTINLSFDVVNPSKPVKVFRGDILYEVSFYSKNLDSGILLKKDEIPKEIIKKMNRQSMVKYFFPGMSRKFIFKNTESKCPFKF